MTNGYQVEVLVPTYNRSAYLQEAVRSALRQTYPHLRVVVVDDCSSDDTSAVVSRLATDEPRVSYFRNATNLGRVANHRRALEECARAALVLMLDDDDVLVDQRYIENAVQVLVENADMVLVFANERVCDLQARLSYVNRMRLPHVMEGTWLLFRWGRGGVGIPHRTALFRRALAVGEAFYSMDVIGDETESFMRFIVGRRVGFIDTVAAEYRIHGENAVRRFDVAELIRNLTIAESVYEHARGKGIPCGALKRWRARMLLTGARANMRALIMAGECRKATKFLRGAARSRPLLYLAAIEVLSPRTWGRFVLARFPRVLRWLRVAWLTVRGMAPKAVDRKASH